MQESRPMQILLVVLFLVGLFFLFVIKRSRLAVNRDKFRMEIYLLLKLCKDVFIRALKAGLIPSTRTLIKIADHLEASIDYLLGLSDDNPQRKTLDDVSFLERLEELRILTNKKYGAIASAVGISRSQFNLWKQKNYIPSLEICYQLALYFNVTIDYLLARE